METFTKKGQENNVRARPGVERRGPDCQHVRGRSGRGAPTIMMHFHTSGLGLATTRHRHEKVHSSGVN